MEEIKVKLSPTCHFELAEYETFPATLTLDYTEHSPAHGYSDSETSVDISKERATQIIELLQRFVGDTAEIEGSVCHACDGTGIVPPNY